MATKQKKLKKQDDAFWDAKQTQVVKKWLQSSEGRETLTKILEEDSESSKIIKRMNTIDRRILIKPYTI